MSTGGGRDSVSRCVVPALASRGVALGALRQNGGSGDESRGVPRVRHGMGMARGGEFFTDPAPRHWMS
jgi:hypothetical protein